MKISFENYNSNTIQNAKSAYSKDFGVSVKGIGSQTDITASLENSNTYEGTKKKSMAEFKNDLDAVDIETTQDAMAVMSNCMSEEDFGEMIKSGKNPASVEITDGVSIVDHIKLAVAKSGKNVAGYTDTLDPEQIEKMTGLRSVAEDAAELDITLTEDICEEIKKAVEEISDVTEMTEGMKKIFVTSESELTIDNLYLAKHSACVDTKEQGSDYFMIEAKGYLAKKGEELNPEELTEEVKELLSNLDIEVTEENVEASVWLVENSVPVTEENIERVKEVESVILPITEEKLSKVIAIAVSEGKEPKNADVTKTENVYTEAVRLTEEMAKLVDEPFVKATRILEETRLKMTEEANLMLLKSNYHIDTKDLEGYVEALKNIENSKEFKEVSELADVTKTVDSIKEMPAAVLAPIASRIDVVTLEEVAFEGNQIKERYEKAGIAYEQVQTEVRKDLGDSIKKAFRNVPEILKELGLENTKENARAVRILGYNSMAITKESVDEIKEADKKLSKVVERLTPQDTLTLIREGKSPIRMSVDELNKYLDSKTDNEKEEIEKYSKFLYKLERDNEISEAERRDYIEVYRFFHQIEKTEGAALGSVINAGQELTFSNLKTALKTAKHRGMDVTVGEVYETLVNAPEGDSLEADWISHKYAQMKEALNAPTETVTELVQNAVPVTAENLEAAFRLRKNRGEAFKKATAASKSQAKEKALSFANDLNEKAEAVNSYDEIISECKAAVYEECMMSDSYMDVRALQLTHMQLTVAKAYSVNENYEVPMEIGGEVSSVNVKVVHNSKEDPNVVISFETENLGRVSARLAKENGEITGYIACNLKESVSKLKNVADTLSTKVSVVWSQTSDTDLTLSKIPVRENDTASVSELYGVAKQFLTSMKG